VSIPYDQCYCGSHCTHQLHISCPLQTPSSPTLAPLLPLCGMNSTRIGTPQCPSVLLILDSLSSISFCSQFLLFLHSSAVIGTPEFRVLIRAPLVHSTLDTPISVLLSLGWQLLNSHHRSYIGSHSPYPPSPFSALLRWESAPQSPSVLLHHDWHSIIWFRTPDPPLFGAPPLVWMLLNPHRSSAA